MPRPVNLAPVRGFPPESPEGAWVRLVPPAVNRLAEARAYERLTPASGFTHTIPDGTGVCLLTPAGTLAAGTLTLPSAASDGFQQEIVTSQAVSALTIAPNSGQTIVGATVFALAAGVKVVYFFVASASTWYKMQ